MKPTSKVIASSEGQAFWQPGIKGNCITIKVSPWNIEKTQHTVFLHELPKDGFIPEHAHGENEELFICLEGEAIISINGEENTFKKHDVAFIAPKDKHSIKTISEEPLKVMVIISPTGLEERLKLMGIEKASPNENPPEAFNSDFARSRTHGIT